MTKLKSLFAETKLLLRNVPSLITALFAVSVVAMNLLANKSIVNLPWLALDGGILFSWLVFLLMDVVTKRFGARAANVLSVCALAINLFFSAFFIAASYIPGLWSQSFVEGAEEVIADDEGEEDIIQKLRDDRRGVTADGKSPKAPIFQHFSEKCI